MYMSSKIWWPMPLSVIAITAATINMSGSACSLTTKLGLPGKMTSRSQPSSSTRTAAAERRAKENRERRRPKYDQVLKLAAIDPIEGMKKVAPLSPPWCKDTPPYEHPESATERLNHKGSMDNWWHDAAVIGSLLCVHPNSSAHQKQTAYFIQAWMIETAQSEKQVIASLTARMDPEKWQQQKDETCARYQTSSESTYGQRAFAEAHQMLFGCKGINSVDSGFPYYYDRRAAPPSQLLGTYVLSQCYDSYQIANDGTLKNSDYRDYSICQFDEPQITRALLTAELDREKHNAFAKTIALETLAVAKRTHREVAQAIYTATKKNSAFKELFIDAPRRGWRAWNKAYKQHKQGIEAAITMEELINGPSLKKAQACGAAQHKGLRRYIAAVKPNRFKSARQAFMDNIGSVLSKAVWACAAAHGHYQEYKLFSRLVFDGQHGRGPRKAALSAARTALRNIVADRPRFDVPSYLFDGPIKERDNQIEEVFEIVNAKNGGSTGHERHSGTVASIRPHPKGKLITFRTEVSKEDTHICRDTRKIQRIEGGRVHYQRKCRSTGSKKVRQTTPPFILPSHATAGIKPGVFIELIGEHALLTQGRPSPGYPIAVYATAKKRSLLAAYGYAVK